MARAPREKHFTEPELAVLQDRQLEAGATPKQAERALQALQAPNAHSQHLRQELLAQMPMPVPSRGDWGPQPIVCRWCGCWLDYSDSSEGRPEELHAPDCFAVKHLGRPARPPRPASTSPRAHTIRRR